jgi:hypothetical protein
MLFNAFISENECFTVTKPCFCFGLHLQNPYGFGLVIEEFVSILHLFQKFVNHFKYL